MADSISAFHDVHFTTRNLVGAYDRICIAFSQLEVPATFAFVLALTLTADERETLGEHFRDVQVDGANWLRHFRAQASQTTEGWWCPQALERVQAEPRLEVACHGFMHLPLSEKLIDRPCAEAEFEAMRTAAKLKKLSLSTFVYPRNLMGYLDLLRSSGYIGFRAGRLTPAGALARPCSLLSEFNVLPSAQPLLPPRDGLVPVPSGTFVNWRHGARRMVPTRVTKLRLARLIDSAAYGGQVAHFWTHPHNMITAPETFDLLRYALQHAARRRDEGRLEILTMHEYCLRQLGARLSGAQFSSPVGA